MATAAPDLNQDELARHPGYLLARSRWRAFRNFHKHIGAPFELKPVEFSILVLVDSNNDVSQVQLAQALGVAAPNMTALLHRLEARGLLERQRSEVDRRRQTIVLTTAGRKLLRKATAASDGMNRGWIDRLTTAEQAMLMELLYKLAV
jgi:DNA-binding MarR family transcriptional regulator